MSAPFLVCDRNREPEKRNVAHPAGGCATLEPDQVARRRQTRARLPLLRVGSAVLRPTTFLIGRLGDPESVPTAIWQPLCILCGLHGTPTSDLNCRAAAACRPRPFVLPPPRETDSRREVFGAKSVEAKFDLKGREPEGELAQAPSEPVADGEIDTPGKGAQWVDARVILCHSTQRIGQFQDPGRSADGQPNCTNLRTLFVFGRTSVCGP